MNRRQFIKVIGTGSLAVFVGSSIYTVSRDKPEHSFIKILEQLQNLNPETLINTGEWNISRVFEHLAQSIEFSMLGYPEMKSEIFQNTVGMIAFEVFESRGKMYHSLDEVIPGEVLSTNDIAPTNALNRLIKALENFYIYDGTLKPHFAYGVLSKLEYTHAHIMHINNHFEEIQTTTL